MNKNTIAVYPAVFSREEDGIVITFPDLPGCISEADDEAGALAMARDALGAWIVATEDLGEPVPPPSRASDHHVEENEAVVLIDVWLPIFRDEHRSGSVKKTSPSVWLNALAGAPG